MLPSDCALETRRERRQTATRVLRFFKDILLAVSPALRFEREWKSIDERFYVKFKETFLNEKVEIFFVDTITWDSSGSLH